VAALIKAVLKSTPPQDVVAGVKALTRANAAVPAKEAATKAAITKSAKARASRDALERPVRRGLSILKLRTRAAERENTPGLYDELFAGDATGVTAST